MKKRLLALALAVVMACGLLPVMASAETVYDFVIDAFCIPHGFVIGYDTVSFSSSSLDKNGELLITPSSKMTEDELNMDVMSEKMLRPNSYNNYGTPCDNPFDTEEWAIVKHFFESEALDRHRPIRVRLYDYPAMVNDNCGQMNITDSQYFTDEIIVYPNPDAYELHAEAMKNYYQSVAIKAPEVDQKYIIETGMGWYYLGDDDVVYYRDKSGQTIDGKTDIRLDRDGVICIVYVEGDIGANYSSSGDVYASQLYRLLDERNGKTQLDVDKKNQEAIIAKQREETAQERQEKAIREQQNNPRYQEYLKANREFLAEHIEERDYIYTIVTDDIQNCSDEICAGLTTDAEKVFAIHKWVTENIYYDYPLLSQPHPWPTAQTVFDKKSYVCSGYTILFQALCWAQKIPCVAVSGTAGGGHAWNAVQVDGEWSWVDATWDTFNQYRGGNRWIKGDQRLDYFRCSSEFLSTNHKATNSGSKKTWSNGEWVTTEYFWCYTTNGVNANLPDQSKEETQQIIEQSNKLLEEEKPLEERLAQLARDNPTLSGWAEDEVVAAIKANLVPADLMDGYNTNMTRQEFCSLVVMMLERATGKQALDYIAEKGLTYKSPFTDTNLPTVGYAYTLGIVNGTSATTFNPSGTITRQEAATMLGRAGRLLGLNAQAGTNFADRNDFPSWAVEGIAYVSGLTDPVSQKKVMEGTGGGFSPTGTYTREQGIITALRLFHCNDA